MLHPLRDAARLARPTFVEQTPRTDRSSRELAFLSLLSLPGLFALGVAVGWIWITPADDPDLWSKPPVEEAEPLDLATEAPPDLEPFTVRSGSERKIGHYRDADGVFHFVQQPPKGKVGVQAKNTTELDVELSR